MSSNVPSATPRACGHVACDVHVSSSRIPIEGARVRIRLHHIIVRHHNTTTQTIFGRKRTKNNKETMGFLQKSRRSTATITYGFILWWLAGQSQTVAFMGALPLVVHREGGIHHQSSPSTTCSIVAADATIAVEQETTEIQQEQEVEEHASDWVQQSFEEAPDPLLIDYHEFEARPFPFNMIVDMDHIKQALILAAVNPRMGGVVISGRRGTAKSVLARAMSRLVPSSIVRVKNSPYNVDPSGKEGMDSILQAELERTNTSLQDMGTERVSTPFVQIPLNAMEDSLLGTVDLEKSMETGTTVFSPGLLARAHRGILYVDEINLLEEEAANILLNVIADGYVSIEREGLSLQYPCKPLLIATYNPQEGELREHLLDRIGVALSSDMSPLTIERRVKGVENVLGYYGGEKEQTFDLRQVEEEERGLQERIATARELLQKVQIDHSQILYLCEEATGAGCEGQRAEIFATEVAKASAAVSENEIDYSQGISDEGN